VSATPHPSDYHPYSGPVRFVDRDMFVHYTHHGIGHPKVLRQMARDCANADLADSSEPQEDRDGEQEQERDFHSSEGDSERDRSDDEDEGDNNNNNNKNNNNNNNNEGDDEGDEDEDEVENCDDDSQLGDDHLDDWELEDAEEDAHMSF
jgi:hypothetical protein